MKIFTILATNLLIVVGIACFSVTDNILVMGVAMASGSVITNKLVWW